MKLRLQYLMDKVFYFCMKLVNSKNLFFVKICLLLTILIATAIPYLQLPSSKFVDFDDGLLIYKNPAVLNFDVKKIFLSFNAEDYLPLTTLSFAIENSIVGLDPFYYHVDNIVLHLCNVGLVFMLINLLIPGQLFITALTALLFGIHPLHVESVAWASQRKDVLSTFFYLLSLIYYIKCTRTKKINFKLYAFSFLLFLLSISSKFMAVSLPGILILFELSRSEKIKAMAFKIFPYAVIMVLFAFIHFKLHDLPVRLNAEKQTLLSGLANGVNSLAFYVTKSIAPFNLTAFYEKNVVTSGIIEYLALLIWLLTIYLFIKFRRNIKNVIFFNLFFLATIFPVLQIIPFGNKFIFADRFMYLPSIGLFCFFSILLTTLKDIKYLKYPVYAGILIMTIGLGYLTYQQTLTWKNSASLWSHGAAIYPNSSILNNNLAKELLVAGDTNRALIYLKKAVDLDPMNPEAHINLSTIYMDQKNFSDAVKQLQIVLEINPKDYNAYFSLGSIAQNQNDWESALTYYKKAVELNSEFATGLLNLSSVLYRLNRKDEALKLLEKVNAIDPNIPEAHSNIGFEYFEIGRIQEAIYHLNRAIELDPNFEQPHRSLALVYIKSGQVARGESELRKAVAIHESEITNPARKRRN